MKNSFIAAAIFSILPNGLQSFLKIIAWIVLALAFLFLVRVGFFSILYQDVLTPLGHVFGNLFGTLGDGIWYTLTGDCPEKYSKCTLPI